MKNIILTLKSRHNSESFSFAMKKNRPNEDAFDFLSNCPDVRNGGKYNCVGDNCGCPEDGETVCIMGICVCMHQRHLAFDQIRCNDPNHASILMNTSHQALKCPTTCILMKPPIV